MSALIDPQARELRAQLLGAVVGGFLVGVTENLVGTYVSFIGTELKMTVALAMIIIVLLVKPSGLFGRSFVRRV